MRSRNYFIYGSVLLALLILPFIILSFYTHPAADDYAYANTMRVNKLVESVIHHQKKWTGRYTATTVLYLYAKIAGFSQTFFTYYKIIPILLLFSFSASVFWCIYALFKNTASRSVLTACALFFIILFILRMPSTAQGFYWLAGATTYMLSIIIFLLVCSLLTTLFTMHRLHYIPFGIATILVILNCGLNETILIPFNLLIFIYCVVAFIQGKKTHFYYYLGLLIICILFSVLSVTAPGNTARSLTAAKSHDFIFSVSKTIRSSFHYIMLWFFYPPFFFSTFLVIPFFYYINKKHAIITRLKTLYVGIAALAGFFTIVVSFFLSFWASGGQPPGRMLNTVYFIFLVIVYALLFLFAASMYRTGMKKVRTFFLGGRFLHFFIGLVTMLVLFGLYHYIPALQRNILLVFRKPVYPYMVINVALLTILNIPYIYRLTTAWKGVKVQRSIVVAIIVLFLMLSGNLVGALTDLLYKTQAYDRQLTDRYMRIKTSKAEHRSDITVDALTNVPESIYFDDIVTDKNDWKNLAYAEFFGISSIQIKSGQSH